MAISSAILNMLYSGASRTGSVDFSFLTKGATSSGTAVAGAGSIKSALSNAEKNEAKQLASVAKDPQVQKDLARYEKVVKNAKSIDDVLNDPVARAVLMTANGLKGDIDNIGLLKKALMSVPKDGKSVAYRMSGINGAWLHIKLGLVGLLLLYYNGFRLAVTSGSKVRNISKWIGIARFQ
jgi:hypothetical protein